MTLDDEGPENGGNTSAFAFVAALLLVLGTGLAGLYWVGARRGDVDAHRIARPPEPSAQPTGAYLQGGRPTIDGPAREVFFAALPEFVIELDRWGRDPASVASEIRTDLEQSRGAVLGAAYKAAVPAQVVERLESLLDACLAAAVVAAEDLDDSADKVSKRVLSLNDALATAGLGFIVDTEILADARSRSILLFTFEVHRVVLHRSGGHDVRTLRVRRLDNLNFNYTLLGFTGSQRRDAVVLDNKVEEHVLSLLPLLAETPQLDPFELDLEETYTDWYTEARKRAIEVVAAEIGEAGPNVVELGTLVAQRHDIYRDWNRLLESRQMSINAPSTLEVTWPYRRQMERIATHASMDRLDAVQKKLTSKDMQEAFANAREHFAQSVERHEVQHRLDLAELYTLPMPEELAAYVGRLPEGYRGGSDAASHALAEASAYLSELARDPLTPRTNLTLLARYLLGKRAWGMSESYAALAIFEGLAAELGLDHTPLVVARSIDRAEVAQLYMTFTELDPDALQDASMTLWARFFKTDLPVLELIAR